MFVDASAIVAILKREPGFQGLADRLDAADGTMTSPVAIVEAVMSLGRQKELLPQEVHEAVNELLADTGTQVGLIDEATSRLAVDAHARFGKGSGHPARLNLGDCFAYAMAKQHSVPLLYKGDDFARTDLA